MKLLLSLAAGYKRVMDRVLTLQSETQTFIDAQLAGVGFDLVLSGCAVTDNGNGTVNIAPGIVYVGGSSIRFAGANNIAADGSQAFVAAAPVVSYPSIFADGSTKNLYSEVFATIANSDPDNNTQMKVGLTLYNLPQFIQDQIYQSEPKGAIKEIYDLDGTFAANFDGTGLGVTPRWLNWALDNGNNGTRGSAGKVIVGAGTYTDPVGGAQTVFADGATAGELNHQLTINEMPAHTHTTNLPRGRYASVDSGSDHPWGPATPNNGTDAVASMQTGNGAAHNNMPPYNVAYRVIKIR